MSSLTHGTASPGLGAHPQTRVLVFTLVRVTYGRYAAQTLSVTVKSPELRNDSGPLSRSLVMT